MSDANPPSIPELLTRIAHLESDLVTVSAQLAVACKERDRTECELVALCDQIIQRKRELNQCSKTMT